MSPAMSCDVNLRDGNVWAEMSATSQKLLSDIARHRHLVQTVSRGSIPLPVVLPRYVGRVWPPWLGNLSFLEICETCAF